MRALVVAALIACGSKTDPPPPPPPAPPPAIALALVFNGSEPYVGNDDLETEDSTTRYFGILKDLAKGIDALDLVHQVPANSQAMLISYDDKPSIRVPMGPIANLSGESLGHQKDYYRHIGSSLVQAVALADAELAKATAPKKVLIIVGDGNDTDNETAKPALARLRQQLSAKNAVVHAIIYKGPLSEPRDVISVLDPEASTVNSVDAIGSDLHRTLRACCHVPTAIANPPPLAVAIVFNGQEIYAGNDDIEPADSKFRYPGILKDLDAAVKATPLPPGTIAGAIAFADHAKIVVPFKPDAKLVLGAQKDYDKVIGNDLVEGLAYAQQALEDTGAKRKLVIVVSDGNTIDNEHGKAQLARFRKELLAEGGEIHAIVWAGPLSPTTPGPIAALDPQAQTIGKTDALTPVLAKLLH